MMNNATASLRSTFSILLLATPRSTISPSRMHTLGAGMAEKKGSAPSAAQNNTFTKCFIVLLKEERITEQEQFGFSDFAVCVKYLIAAVVLLCLEHVTTDMWGAV